MGKVVGLPCWNLLEPKLFLYVQSSYVNTWNTERKPRKTLCTALHSELLQEQARCHLLMHPHIKARLQKHVQGKIRAWRFNSLPGNDTKGWLMLFHMWYASSKWYTPSNLEVAGQVNAHIDDMHAVTMSNDMGHGEDEQNNLKPLQFWSAYNKSDYEMPVSELIAGAIEFWCMCK